MYQPHLYVGIGETHAYFTLRETQLVYVRGHGSIETSFHHVNLSQDPTEAWAKATDYASKLGMALHGSPDKLADDMREIKRMSADALRERQERLAKIEADRLEAIQRWNREAREMIDNGIVPFGRFFNSKIEDVQDRGYLSWMAANTQFEVDSIQEYFAKALNERYQHKLLPKADPTMHIGTVGQRREFVVTVTRHFRFQTIYGVMHIITMVDESGACIVSKSNSFYDADVGDVLKIKATIKAHDEYKGQAQTVVQRIKVL